MARVSRADGGTGSQLPGTRWRNMGTGSGPLVGRWTRSDTPADAVEHENKGHVLDVAALGTVVDSSVLRVPGFARIRVGSAGGSASRGTGACFSCWI